MFEAQFKYISTSCVAQQKMPASIYGKIMWNAQRY